MNQEKKPLVTIITITFNLINAGREKYFRQCLESVHDQSYENIEHIVIDGASSDGTIELIREYADRGWIKYISEKDSGIYDAMNKSIKLANGKYLAFLNSDDYYNDKEGVLYSIKALEDNGADFSYASVNMINEDGSKLNQKHPHCVPKVSDVFFVMPFCHQTMFTRRDVIIKEGMFDENFKSAGDYEFVIRLCLKNYKCIFVEKKFVTFRWGGFSVSNNALSINEVAAAYYKNYSKLCLITKEECGKIYCTGYNNIPSNLAKKLRKLERYFNHAQYLQSNKLKGRINFVSNRIFKKYYSKFEFIFFSPKKFARKYITVILNSRLRQPARCLYYLIRIKNK